MASIKDVAKAAGVSPSTVSRVVNGSDTSAASPETQERIWNAVRELGYVLNQNARSLKRPLQETEKAKRDIDCVYARTAGSLLDPFFTELMHEIEVEALKYGFHLRYQYSIAQMRADNIPLREDRADAAIILGRTDEETIRWLQSMYRHLICVGLQDRDFPVDQVLCHGYQAAKNCVDHLHALGHRAICYLGETVDEQRYQAFLDAMHRIGSKHPEDLAVEAPFSPAGGYDAVQKLLQDGKEFTAILCANDMLAVGALKALKEHRFRVPKDVSLIGINDMETSRYLDPMLTTVAIPMQEMGQHVAKLLIDRINGGHTAPVKLVIPSTLICRESCAPVQEL